jgi:pimeloyl-ACP methyl ester carboxylesterase
MESEQEHRRRMNEHIIAVDETGLAIEPYDYRYLGKSFGGGFFKPHWGGTTPLQVSLKHSALATNALRSIGKSEPEISSILANVQPDMFVYRDIVVSNMIQRASASGKRVMVFVHGGLNNLDEAIGRAEEMLSDQMDENHNLRGDTYPIFICWPSALGSSYWQHLWEVRNGVDIHRDHSAASYAWSTLTLPIYLTTDILTSAVRMPRTMTDLGRTDIKTEHPFWFGDVVDSQVRYMALSYAQFCLTNSSGYGAWTNRMQPFDRQLMLDLESKTEPKGSGEAKWDFLAGRLKSEWHEIASTNSSWHPVIVSRGPYETETWDEIERKFFGWTLVGSKVLVAGTLSAAGAEAWGMMRRRVDAMFHDEDSIRPNHRWHSGSKKRYEETNLDVRDSSSTGIGAVAVLFRGITKSQSSGQFPNRLDVYGHSMGSLVINRALEEFPEVEIDRIVYLAAACSIREFAHSVIPYLRSNRSGRLTEFYNLTLHPRAEERERSGWEIVPRGSLLIWIDDFLENPHSFEERVFGQFENALLASKRFPPAVQSRIHLTAMGAGPKVQAGPQTHGGFTEYRFWEPNFVELEGWHPARNELLKK